MADILVPDTPLPVAPVGRLATGWYGMLFLIATEAALFVYLLFSYFYLASQTPGAWPPTGAPDLMVASLNTAILLASSLAAWWGQKGIEKGAHAQLMLGLASAFGLGAIFVGVQVHEWAGKGFTPATDAYGSL
ncbi:MAG: cytochrome c oxidase subunit 3, partial [Caulobacteraceae bacterium]